MAQSFGVETSLHVEVVNTLVTAVAAALIVFLTPGLQRWLSRRHWNSVSRGETSDLLVSEGFDGVREFFWKVHQHSAGGGERGRVIRDLLPYVLVIAGLQLLPFSTSGVGANTSDKNGTAVKVIGSLANPTADMVETLDLNNLWYLQRGDFDGEAAPFLLGSPELFNLGTNVIGLDWGVRFSGVHVDSSTETEDGATDLRIFGDRFTVEQDGPGEGTYPVSTCLTVTEADGVYSVGTCEGVRVELEQHEFVVESIQSVYWTSQSCEALTYAVLNQGVTYRWRTLTLPLDVDQTFTFTEETLIEGTDVSALCGEIYESVIEACIFNVGGHLYVGDWNIGEFEDSCEPDDGSNDDYDPYTRSMTVIEMDASRGMLPSSEEYEVAAAMLAEVVAGSGTIYSRNQLALVLGVFSRISGMKLGVGTAYYPETVVVVSISPVVLVLWALLLAAGCVIYVRERRLGCKVFIPTNAWDWFAVGARESLGDGSASLASAPSAHHYLTKYGCQKSSVESDGGIQRLSWIVPGTQEAEANIPPIPPPTRRPELGTADTNVEASRNAPRSIDTPLRRWVRF